MLTAGPRVRESSGDSQLEEYEDSIQAHSRALAIQRSLRGPDDLATACAGWRSSMPEMVREGDAARARPLFERALRTYERTYGARHSKTIAARGEVEALMKRSPQAR
jgi:hypothetical protein